MIIILGAMDSEIDEFPVPAGTTTSVPLERIYAASRSTEGQDVLVSKSGVGKVMSAMVTQHLIDRWQPSAVIFTGLAGSCSHTSRSATPCWLRIWYSTILNRL